MSDVKKAASAGDGAGLITEFAAEDGGVINECGYRQGECPREKNIIHKRLTPDSPQKI